MLMSATANNTFCRMQEAHKAPATIQQCSEQAIEVQADTNCCSGAVASISWSDFALLEQCVWVQLSDPVPCHGLVYSNCCLHAHVALALSHSI